MGAWIAGEQAAEFMVMALGALMVSGGVSRFVGYLGFFFRFAM